MENIPILSPPMSFADQYFILSLCVMKELYESSAHSVMKEAPQSSYSISATFFDKFPLLFHLNESIPTSSLTVDFLEKLKTHEFILDEFVKEDYYLPPPEALNIDNIFHLASTTLGYPYEKTWKTVKKLVRGGLVVANTDSSNIHTYNTATDNNSMAQQTAQYIRSTYGDEYVKETGESSLLSIERITGAKSVARLPTPEDDPLYTLIWERSIQSSMKPAYYHRYRLRLNTPIPNMSFVQCLDVPIFRGWTRMASSLTPTLIDNSKHGIHPTTPHNVLLYLQSLNRESPIYCKRVIAESRVSPEITYIGIEEGAVVEKLKELGIEMEAIRRAGFFQIHKRMGLVKDVAAEGGGGEGFVLSFDKGREIELFKEPRMGKSKEPRMGKSKETRMGVNRIVLNELGLACAEHFHNTYRYLLDSKEYITPPTIENPPTNKRIAGANSIGGDAIIRNGMEENISNELHNYINEIIEQYNANGGGEGRLIGQYRGTELKIKRNEGGEDGYYLEWGSSPHLQRKSLESVPSFYSLKIHSFEELDEKGAIDIIEGGIRKLENSADYKRIFRILDPYTSIRHGKFGTYIYHRTEEMKKTKFLSLKKCPFNYMTAPTEEIMGWVYQRINTHLK